MDAMLDSYTQAQFANAAIMLQENAALQRLPHVLLRPAISIDGNKWCALYGENLHDGCAGFGDTPALAMADFDKNWFEQRITNGVGAPAPYRCIKPQCPNDCSMCNHAIPSDDAALTLIADLLDGLAVDGFGGPLEDGESALVDRARQFLARARRNGVPDRVTAADLQRKGDHDA